jgi:hypothetical protein
MSKNISFEDRVALLTNLASDLKATQTCYVENAKNLSYKEKNHYFTYNSQLDKNKVNHHKWWSHIEVRVKPNNLIGNFSLMCALSFDEKGQLSEKYTTFFFRNKNVNEKLLSFVQSKKSKYFSDFKETQNQHEEIQDAFAMPFQYYGFYKVEKINRIDIDTFKADLLKFVVHIGNEFMKEMDEFLSSLT